MKVLHGEALTDNGTALDKYEDIDGETFRWKAHGPSFYNGLGKFEVEKVNAAGLGDKLSGGIDAMGKVTLAAWPGHVKVEDPLLFTAFGRMCEDPDFLGLLKRMRGHSALREVAA